MTPEPGEGSASDEPDAAAKSRRHQAGSASDEPHAAAKSRRHQAGSASDEPDAAAKSRRHQAGSASDEPDAAAKSRRQQHWFEPIAEHLGNAYLRYSFTKGTRQEVDFLVGALGLTSGQRVLDVGCGPGRHARALAERGLAVHGVDISATFVDLARHDAPRGATFEVADARHLRFDAEFDAVICLCQGAFGLMTANGEDDLVFGGMARALRPGGRLALSAFNAYFAVRHHDEATFDAATGVSHEVSEVRNPAGDPLAVDLWTGCYTPRELRLMADRHGLRVDRLSSVEPGRYGDDPPTAESPEFLLLATKAAGTGARVRAGHQ